MTGLAFTIYHLEFIIVFPPRFLVPSAPLPTTEGEVAMKFEDIQIADLDEKKSYQPDARKVFYYLYFTLSSLPPEGWGRIFETRWNVLPRRYTWRHAWVEGQYIVLHCAPEELDDERYQILRYLKEAVSGTNYQYRQFLARREQGVATDPQAQEKPDENLVDLKRRLKLGG